MMRNHRKNVRKRADGRYEARCIVGYENIYGKAIYRYLYARTYREAVEKLELCQKENLEEVEFQRVLRKNKSLNPDTGIIAEKLKQQKTKEPEKESLCLKEWLEQWMKFNKKLEIKNSSYTQYSSVIRNHLIPELGAYRLQELTGVLVQQYIEKKRTLNNHPLSPATIKRHITILNSAMRQAVKQGMIAENPCQDVVLPMARKKKKDVFDAEEYRQLVKHLAGQLDDPKAAAVLLALKTGIRLGELAALRWKDIDFSAASITVQDAVHRVNISGESGKKTEMIFEGTKSTYSERVIPMNDEIYALLKKYESKLDEKSRGEFLFSNHKGSFIDPRIYQTYFTQVLKATGIRKRNFHMLRHTFATMAASRNMQISVLSRILGHASVTTTLKLYVHPFTEQDRIEMNKISEFTIKDKE